MTARPIYTIIVEDMVSHVEWTLMRDEDEVDGGWVELSAYSKHEPLRQIGLAFARAWQEANSERVRRLLEDLDTGQVDDFPATAERALKITVSDFIGDADPEEVDR
jgi:hypothetical protein